MKNGKFDKLVENVLSGKTLFAEGKSSAKARYVDTEKITDDVFKKLLELDTTSNKRFVEWMAKMVAETPALADSIDRFKVVQDFEKLNLEQKLTPEQKDFVRFKVLEDMEKVIADISAAGPSKSELKAGITKKVRSGKVPAELQERTIWEGPNSFVLKPETKEEGIKFGNKGGSKWCISSDTEGQNQWDRFYYQDAANIYIIVPFQPEKWPENYKKIAVLAYPGGKTEWWDFNNDSKTLDPKKVTEALGDETWL